MERKSKKVNEVKKAKKKNKKAKKEEGIKLRKINGGSFRTKKGRIIKPGQVFFSKWEDIPKAFRDSVVPVDPEEVKEAEKDDAPDKVSKYFVQAAAPGWYDVVDADGKKQNEKSLRQKKADDLLKSLS